MSSCDGWSISFYKLNSRFQVDGQNGIPEGMTVVAALQPQDIQLIHQTPTNQTENEKSNSDIAIAAPMALIKNELKETDVEGASITVPANYIQNTAAVQEYLQRIQSSTLPLSLQQFLRFNTDTAVNIKREKVS